MIKPCFSVHTMMNLILPSQTLTEQHQQIDECLRLLCQGSGDGQRLSLLIHSLKTHIYIEEALIFPLINRGRFKTALAIMKAEHGAMWDCLQQLPHLALGKPEFIAQCQALSQLLQAHNPKEEAAIYPAVDEFHLHDREPVTLLDEIEQAALPANWLCAARAH